MKFNSIEFKGHSFFADGKIEFKDFNVIIGGNASGKTQLYNLLKEGLKGKTKGCKVKFTGKPTNVGCIFTNEMDLSELARSKQIEKIRVYPKECSEHSAEIVFRQGSAGANYFAAFLFSIELHNAMHANDPLVLDCVLSRLGHDWREKMMTVIRAQKRQVIMFEREHPKPDYLLVHNKKTANTEVMEYKAKGGKNEDYY